MSDPKIMSPAELAVYARTWTLNVEHIAARDAALVQQAFRDAAARYMAWYDGKFPKTTYPQGALDAIMGTPPLVKGMVVRVEAESPPEGLLAIVDPQPGHSDMVYLSNGKNYYRPAVKPVKGHADAAGNLFVDGED